MKNKYYTYAYLQDDGKPYYIGKGKGNRAYSNWGRKIAPKPLDSSKIIFLKKNLTEAQAFKHEIYMIAVLGRKDLGTGLLLNLTDGGDGVSGRKCSQATKLKMSIAQTGKKHSEARRAAIGKGNKGKHIPESTRTKMRQTMSGRKYSAEHKQRISEALTKYHASKGIDNEQEGKRN